MCCVPQSYAVTGATGLLGRALCQKLISRGDQVTVLSRDPERAKQLVPGCHHYVRWTPQLGPWQSSLEGITGVIHLAGAPIFAERWSTAYKEQIRSSRVAGTQGILEAIRHCQNPPEVLVSASAIGYYGFRDGTPLEETAPSGQDFLAQVCVAWEAAAQPSPIRTVILRLGIVLDPQDGALAKMLPPFWAFGGGPLGTGTQWFSWIHREDAVGAMIYGLDHPLNGVYNGTAPEALTMTDFCQTLGRVISRPSWLPVPRPALELLLGEGAVVLVEGQRVIPKKLTGAGYTFQFPTAQGALQDLLG